MEAAFVQPLFLLACLLAFFVCSYNFFSQTNHIFFLRSVSIG